MAEDLIFKFGYCPNCGQQSQVTDTKNGIIAGYINSDGNGSTLCWLGLSDSPTGLPIKTRIGTFALCPDCDPSEADPNVVFNSLVNSPYSGITPETVEPENTLYPSRSIEVIKKYGE